MPPACTVHLCVLYPCVCSVACEHLCLFGTVCAVPYVMCPCVLHASVCLLCVLCPCVLCPLCVSLVCVVPCVCCAPVCTPLVCTVPTRDAGAEGEVGQLGLEPHGMLVPEAAASLLGQITSLIHSAKSDFILSGIHGKEHSQHNWNKRHFYAEEEMSSLQTTTCTSGRTESFIFSRVISVKSITAQSRWFLF